VTRLLAWSILPDLSLAQAILVVGLVFAWLVFILARAWFEQGR
jgi:hypothetical protein